MWMLAAATAPEYILWTSANDYFRARKTLRYLTLKQKQQDWTMTHMLFAFAGGFWVRTPNGQESKCHPKQLRDLIINGSIEGPPILQDELKSRAKADWTVKLIAILQILWFLVQILARATQHYHITSLEILTVAFVFCSIFIYAFSFRKPQDVEFPVFIEIPDALHDIAEQNLARDSNESGTMLHNVARARPEHSTKKEDFDPDKAAEKEDAIRRDPQLLEFESEVRQLKRRRSPTCDIKAAESKVRAYRASLRKKRLQQYKLEWIRERRDWKVKTRGKESPDDEKRTDLLDILSRVMPERGRLAKMMISDRVVMEEERKEAIQDLCSLASRDCTVLYRPGEQPTQGLCPVKACGLSMISLRKPHRSTHIHNCRKRELAKTLKRLESELNLQMSPHMRKSWQHKRQRQDSDEQELRPSKQRQVPPTIDLTVGSTLWHSHNRTSPNCVPTVTPHMLSKVSFTDLSADDDRENVPPLTHSGTTSPPESDPSSLTDNLVFGHSVQHQCLRDELEWLGGSPEKPMDTCKLLTQDNDTALFSQYLRFPVSISIMFFPHGLRQRRRSKRMLSRDNSQ
ncbi:hypothetical protein OEA41_007274 [Lepraria neglecta]|uniref:Uncharacterized protein n=1 Tax=Lepraria neglecta TaxID=209136 RepID=A0AAD9ZCV4_9LECA|nr:hypothetical protein OEA41_007274 [Lepraria neglecta]